MSLRQHARAVNVGIDFSKRLKTLQDSLGTGKIPHGKITSLYSKYILLLKSARSLSESRKYLAEMRKELAAILLEFIEEVDSLGNMLSYTLLDIYDLENELGDPEFDPKITIIAALSVFDMQRDKVLAGLQMGTDPNVLFGDGSRVGVLSYGAVSKEVAHFASTLISYIIDYRIIGDEKYFKQAVAALDHRTTNCCVLVHGQVQEWKKPFILNGIPRFANRIKFPPFHTWCRTVFVLVHEDDVDDDVTRKMRAQARAFLPNP